MEYFKILIMLVRGILVADGSRWFKATDLNDFKTMVPIATALKSTDINDQNVFVEKSTHSKSYGQYLSNLFQTSTLSSDMTKFQPSQNFPVTSKKAPILEHIYNKGNPVNSSGICISSRCKNNINATNSKESLLEPDFSNVRQLNQLNLNQTQRRRFLEVFEVVEFDHVPCTSTSGLEGTCRHDYDCQSIGGSAMGSCADGFGTCCIITMNCDSRTAAPVGWFINPNFPSPSSERLSCAVTIDKSSTDIVQIRLDFMNFEVLPPNYGTCEQDQFLVTGQDVNNVIPILCGINTGQHIYVEVGNTDGPINLSFQTLNEENRLFSIKVTQLTLSDDLTAPKGCLQYFKEANGHLESFNYRDRSEIGITRISSYLNNLNYAMCIEREPTSCSITYTNIGEMQIVNYDTEGLPILPPRQAGVEIFNCPSDWLLISAVRLCGERLNDGSVLQDFSLDAPVTDDGAGPMTVWFRTDGVYAGRGFKLRYQQNMCSPPNSD